MKRLMRYILYGAKNSMIIGVPDFSQNNFAQDMRNIGSDFDVVIKRIDASGVKQKRDNRQHNRTRETI